MKLGYSLARARRRWGAGGGSVSSGLRRRLNVFGDSITAGTGATTENDRWVTKVAFAKGIPLINNGISGTVLQNSISLTGAPLVNNGRDRYVSALLTGVNLSSNYIIAYGLNDLRYNQSVTPPSEFTVVNFKNDYREVIQGLLAAGVLAVDICLVTPYWIPTAGYSVGGTGFTGSNSTVHEAYVQAVIELAAEFSTTIRDVYTAMKNHANPASLIGADNLHPNDVGHAFIASIVSDIPVVAGVPVPSLISVAQRTAVLTDTAGDWISNDGSASFNGIGLLSGAFTVGSDEVWIEGVYNNTSDAGLVMAFGTTDGTPATSGNNYLVLMTPAGVLSKAYNGASSTSAGYTLPAAGTNVKVRLKCGVDGVVVIQTSTDSITWTTRYAFGVAASGTYYARIYTSGVRKSYQLKSVGIQ